MRDICQIPTQRLLASAFRVTALRTEAVICQTRDADLSHLHARRVRAVARLVRQVLGGDTVGGLVEASKCFRCHGRDWMPLTKLTEPNRPRYVVDQILASIEDGSLEAGERLPSEAKLAELTGVGRTSVREALAALRLMGVVETRVGDGSYVRESASTEVATNGIAQAIEKSEEAQQLQEARAVFECGLVRLVVIRWSPEKAEVFEGLLSDMSDAADRECYEDYLRLHRDFHLRLAQATDNPILERTERSFLEFMDHEGWQDMERQFLLPERAEYLQGSFAEHASIIESISVGDVVEAGDRMHEHFTRHQGGGDS